MKRPILIVVIGYIIGIIVGLYFNKSIVLIYISIIAIYLIQKFLKKKKREKLKLFSIKRYIRYIKIYLNSKVITLLIISSIVSNSIVIYQNNKYEEIYKYLNNKPKIETTAIIISNKQDKQFYNKYKVETKLKNKKIKLYITTNKNYKLNYGDKIKLSGEYIKPEIQRNYKGFDYSQYLKQLKIYGTIKCKEVEKINEKQGNIIIYISNQISNKIRSNIKKILKEESYSILLGLTLGDKTYVEEEIQENFRNASIAHILAVSGMHVTYILLGINIMLKNKIGKKNTNILSIIILIFYMLITDATPSITRATIMGVIMIFSKIIYRKNDNYTSISISLLLILIHNPFLIQNLGLQLSYGGIIGIILFNKNILEYLNKIEINNKLYKYKIRPKIHEQINKFKEIIAVSISVQIFILPIILYNINIFNPYFLISNLLLSIIIGFIVIIGFIFIIIALINFQIAKIFTNIIEFIVQILIFISKIGEIPYSKIYLYTPSLLSMIIYYLFLSIMFYLNKVYSSKNPNKTQIRVRNIIALVKIKLRGNIKRLKRVLLSIILILIILIYIPKKLTIHFIDVGQGDSCMIVTPRNKVILIDGGGSMNSDFDVGKRTLVPYILDRGFSKIDVVIISHFDDDHVRFNSIFITRNKYKKCHNRKAI